MFKQTIDRGVNSFHHKEPFWYYAANIGLTVLPWTLLLIAVYIKAIIKRCFIKDPLTRFFFIIIASSFITLSAVSSKINIYMLPIYPFLIYFGFVLLKKVKPDYFIYSGADEKTAYPLRLH